MASASDDFNRANENPLAGNWESVLGNLQLTSNTVKATTGQCLARYKSTSTSFTANHWSQASPLTMSAFDYPAWGVRLTTTSGGNGYYVVWETDSNRFQWWKLTNGTPAKLGSTIAATVANGDVVRAEAVTNGANCDLKVYVNSAQQGATLTDSSSPHTGGQPGIGAENGNTNGTALDSWSAEDDAGGGGGISLAWIRA